MIVLSKLLPLFVYPLGLAMVLAGAAVFFVYKDKKKVVYWLLGICLFLLYFFSNEIVSSSLLKTIERRHLPININEVKAGAIVVLGGGGRPRVYPRSHAEFNEGGERMFHGIRLYRTGAAPVVIVSGGGIDFMIKGQKEGEDMRAIMAEFGVPYDSIIVESAARNTRENATLVKQIMDERKIGKRILLVTSASHMVRSVKIFKKAGFHVVPAPVDYLIIDKGYSWFSLMPSVEHLSNSTRAIKEFIGIAVYGMLGWL